jgi:predicted TIM-barrel enzyme
LIHGGPIALPEDAQYVLERCPECHGFYGASSMERLPVEQGIRHQIESFKRIKGAR